MLQKTKAVRNRAPGFCPVIYDPLFQDAHAVFFFFRFFPKVVRAPGREVAVGHEDQREAGDARLQEVISDQAEGQVPSCPKVSPLRGEGLYPSISFFFPPTWHSYADNRCNILQRNHVATAILGRPQAAKIQRKELPSSPSCQ